MLYNLSSGSRWLLQMFRNEILLGKHLKNFQVKRDFECSHCDKVKYLTLRSQYSAMNIVLILYFKQSFCQSGQLRAHLYNHHGGGGLYDCPKCSVRFFVITQNYLFKFFLFISL